MNNKKCLYKAVVFDMDGTILDTLSDLAAAGNYVLEKMNLKTYSEHEYKSFIGNGLKNLIIKMMPEKSEEAELKKAYRVFYDCYSESKFNKTVPYPGIEDFIRKLSNTNIKIGIITNKPHIPACEMAEHYFKGLINLTYGSTDCIPKKPDPVSLLKMIECFEMNTDDVLFVGDSTVDIKTAKNAGVKSCGVLWGFGKEEEIIEAGADFIVKNTNELYNIVFNSR